MLQPDSLIQLLLARLERISVDSPLAHRASGVRGALLRSLEMEQGNMAADQAALNDTVRAAFAILREAAAEIRRGRSSGL